ncbi:hypothetical protein K505DRAFT_379832 [Melanomma pulvis-pyrius CBS 109.77]|uniref:Macro domain-containing protein n=1 Tax=Melanomma pulvis-pyrius CBS 109.77 TaxID=1314802 RepID=A0A6A6WSF3_9PLEO|nr:hypothetical protein K505DRAFT_379832 [Melanomma pulvis-pyrius CBS 109.77]
MATIRLGTAVNIRLFLSLSAALNTGDSKLTQLIDNEALEDEFGRFRVWSGNLGALQKGHSALDYRLRDSPLLSNNALKLLKELEENLSEAIAVVSGSRLPYEQQPKPEETEEGDDDDDDDDGFFSEDEDDGSETGAPKTELEQRFREVIDIIDNLYKLSVRIRTPTIRSRSLKASSYRPKDPETGVDILDQYATFDLQYTRELVTFLRAPHTNDVKDDDPIIERLAKAITLRRRQFKYWKRHRDKLGVSTVLEEGLPDSHPLIERPDAPHRHDTLEIQLGNPIVAALKDAASEQTGKTMLSGTEATRHHQSLDDVVDSRSVTSYATTVRDLTGRGIDLPPPPKTADGDKDFECPYCFIICPARYGKGRAWKTHILQDLQPYVCTYTDCESSEQLFRSRREWSDHEASHRKAWRCPEHPTAVYRSKSGLEDHLRRKHSDSFPETQLNSIINVGETSTVDTREKCPICFVEVDMEAGFHLQNHVANHLERLAAFALPRNVNDDLDGASSVASRGRSASTGSQNLSDVSFHSDIGYVEEEETPADIAKPDSTSLYTSQEQASGSSDIPSAQGILSAEMLGHLPDSSQKRLDILFPSQMVADDNFDERIFDDAAEVVDHLAELQVFRAYLLSLPGSQSVRFLRRFGWWRGYTNFEDEASALRAMEVFDRIRFPDVTASQGVENKATLKFSFPTLGKSEKDILAPTRQSTGDPSDSSESTASFSYDGSQDESGQSPLLSLSKIPTLSSLYKSRKLLQRDQSYAPNDAFNQIISFSYYDITRLKVDAIVNSANGAMKITRVSETLNNRIHKQAGPGLQRECKAAGKVKTGQVRITSGCDLPSTYVIHAARPQYSGSKGTKKFSILTECYRNALKTAMNHGIKTIAFPCLAAGGCGFPSRRAARIALQEVREFLDVHKGYTFERIIFCVYSGIDEKAYKDLLPVFFPPTHGDLENATPFEPFRDRDSVAIQLQEAYNQIEVVYQELVDFSEDIYDFPHSVLSELASISSPFNSLKTLFFGDREIKNLNGLTVSDVDLICSVMQSMSGGVMELIEQSKYARDSAVPTHKSIWDDYNIHMKSSKGMDLLALLELCQDFVQSLDDILVRDGIEPYEMSTMRVRLGSYRLKQTGEGLKGVQDHFDEVMYTREFQRGATPSHRSDIIKVHSIPSIARLYQLGDLEYKPTFAIASTDFNHIVCLWRDDITRLETDVIVNSTDPRFSSMGTLDRTIFQKGGPAMQQACNELGACNEGDFEVTPGFLLPAKHVIHAIPPETYRTNTKDVLRKLYRGILYTAGALKASSIAIPTIGTGMLNYPRRDCAALALEEVKRFLERAKPDNSIEKIVFCVFGSNDEVIYKTLLPVYFPPVDLNMNKALPASTNKSSLSMSSLSINSKGESPVNESTPPPRHTLFGSIGEAFRNVRFGKQSVKERSRTLNPTEEHALIKFEDHCHDCNTCNNIAKLYAEGRSLCLDGYTIAQSVLQYLYMETDRSVYSTNLEEDERVKVEIPPQFRYSWNLLVTVEKSYRDNDRNKPFASPNQPYMPEIEQGERSEDIPPGVTIHSAEVTVPVQMKPEMATAFLFRWSKENDTWEPLNPNECRIHIHPGKVELYATDQQSQARQPLLYFDLTPSISIQLSDADVVVDGAWKERLMLRCSNPTECQSLVDKLKQSSISQILEQDQETILDVPSVPLDDPSTPTATARPVSTLTQQINDMKASSQQSADSYSMLNLLAKRVLAYLRVASTLSGVHEHVIADDLGADPVNVVRAVADLKALSLIHNPSDEHIWAAVSTESLDIDSVPALREQRPPLASPPPRSSTIDSEPSIASPTTQQRSATHEPRSTTPITGPNLDLSIAGLSSVNIDDFFTYLDLAVPPTNPSSQHPQNPHPSLTRSMSLPASPNADVDADPTPTHAPQDDDDAAATQIHHPRPGTPDHGQPAPIPPGVRWTKIDRRLVNPEALEEAAEKFEEWEHCVVVFRVLSRDEVRGFAERTREIRRAGGARGGGLEGGGRRMGR